MNYVSMEQRTPIDGSACYVVVYGTNNLVLKGTYHAQRLKVDAQEKGYFHLDVPMPPLRELTSSEICYGYFGERDIDASRVQVWAYQYPQVDETNPENGVWSHR